VGCLALTLTSRFFDFCLFMLTLVVAQKCTLITSLSEFSVLFSRRKQCDCDADTAYPSLFIMLLIKSNIEFLSTTYCSTMVSSYQSAPSYAVALCSLKKHIIFGIFEALSFSKVQDLAPTETH
jgi:hypothetical protein